jgi:hypothetical protein
MDASTDLGYALYGLQQPDPRPYIDLTMAEVEASLIPKRAGLLAAEIASRMPHLVTLQKVTLWRTGPTPATATTVRYDQLKLLMTALKGLEAPYEVVAVNTLTDIALPTTEAGPCALRFTDRDVLLARSDLSPSVFQLSDVHVHIYEAASDAQSARGRCSDEADAVELPYALGAECCCSRLALALVVLAGTTRRT